MPCVRFLPLLLLLVVTGCESGSNGPAGMGALADDGPVLSLDPATAPAVEVPGPAREVFGSEAHPIQSVRALRWTRDGQILLADAGRSVLLLSDEGDSLRTLGRPGEGPGEFLESIGELK